MAHRLATIALGAACLAVSAIGAAGSAVTPATGTYHGTTSQPYYRYRPGQRPNFTLTKTHLPIAVTVRGGKVRRITLRLNIDDAGSPDCGGKNLPLSRTYAVRLKHGRFTIHDRRAVSSTTELSEEPGSPNDLRIDGRFTSATTATGSLQDRLTALGIGYCDSGRITWTAKR